MVDSPQGRIGAVDDDIDPLALPSGKAVFGPLDVANRAHFLERFPELEPMLTNLEARTGRLRDAILGLPEVARASFAADFTVHLTPVDSETSLLPGQTAFQLTVPGVASLDLPFVQRVTETWNRRNALLEACHQQFDLEWAQYERSRDELFAALEGDWHVEVQRLPRLNWEDRPLVSPHELRRQLHPIQERLSRKGRDSGLRGGRQEAINKLNSMTNGYEDAHKLLRQAGTLRHFAEVLSRPSEDPVPVTPNAFRALSHLLDTATWATPSVTNPPSDFWDASQYMTPVYDPVIEAGRRAKAEAAREREEREREEQEREEQERAPQRGAEHPIHGQAPTVVAHRQHRTRRLVLALLAAGLLSVPLCKGFQSLPPETSALRDPTIDHDLDDLAVTLNNAIEILLSSSLSLPEIREEIMRDGTVDLLEAFLEDGMNTALKNNMPFFIQNVRLIPQEDMEEGLELTFIPYVSILKQDAPGDLVQERRMDPIRLTLKNTPPPFWERLLSARVVVRAHELTPKVPEFPAIEGDPAFYRSFEEKILESLRKSYKRDAMHYLSATRIEFVELRSTDDGQRLFFVAHGRNESTGVTFQSSRQSLWIPGDREARQRSSLEYYTFPLPPAEIRAELDNALRGCIKYLIPTMISDSRGLLDPGDHPLEYRAMETRLKTLFGYPILHPPPLEGLSLKEVHLSLTPISADQQTLVADVVFQQVDEEGVWSFYTDQYTIDVHRDENVYGYLTFSRRPNLTPNLSALIDETSTHDRVLFLLKDALSRYPVVDSQGVPIPPHLGVYRDYLPAFGYFGHRFNEKSAPVLEVRRPIFIRHVTHEDAPRGDFMLWIEVPFALQPTEGTGFEFTVEYVIPVHGAFPEPELPIP